MCGGAGWLSLQPSTEHYAMRLIVLNGLQENTSTYSHLSTLTNYLPICVFHLFHKMICAELHTSHSVAIFNVYVLCVRTQAHTHICVCMLYLFTEHS